MKTIDLHTHLRRDRETHNYLVEELLQESERFPDILRMISCLDGEVHQSNWKIRELCETYPERFIGCAVIDPKREDALQEAEDAASCALFKAFEFNSLEHGYIPETMPVIDDIFDLAERQGMFIKCFTGWGDHTFCGQWEYYLYRHPNVKVIFLHMGDFWDGYSCIDIAQRHGNLYLDTSHVYELSIMRNALKRVSHDRFVFGSYFPNMLTKWSLEFVDAYKLSEEDREKFLYKNALKLLEQE